MKLSPSCYRTSLSLSASTLLPATSFVQTASFSTTTKCPTTTTRYDSMNIIFAIYQSFMLIIMMLIFYFSTSATVGNNNTGNTLSGAIRLVGGGISTTLFADDDGTGGYVRGARRGRRGEIERRELGGSEFVKGCKLILPFFFSF